QLERTFTCELFAGLGFYPLARLWPTCFPLTKKSECKCSLALPLSENGLTAIRQAYDQVSSTRCKSRPTQRQTANCPLGCMRCALGRSPDTRRKPERSTP